MNPRQSGLPRRENDVWPTFNQVRHRQELMDQMMLRLGLIFPQPLVSIRARLSFRRAQRAGTAQMKAHAGYGWMKRERDQSLPIFAPMCASSAGVVCSAVTDYGENDACLTA